MERSEFPGSCSLPPYELTALNERDNVDKEHAVYFTISFKPIKCCLDYNCILPTPCLHLCANDCYNASFSPPNVKVTLRTSVCLLHGSTIHSLQNCNFSFLYPTINKTHYFILTNKNVKRYIFIMYYLSGKLFLYSLYLLSFHFKVELYLRF